MLRSVVLVMLSAQVPFRGVAESSYGSDCNATREFSRRHCDYVLAYKGNHKTIFIGGDYGRTLAAAYRIFGERRYLDTAIAYGDRLLDLQSPRGYWPTRYSDIYLADTGSALGLFIALYNDVDRERQQKYFSAVKTYVTDILSPGVDCIC